MNCIFTIVPTSCALHPFDECVAPPSHIWSCILNRHKGKITEEGKIFLRSLLEKELKDDN